MSHPQPIYINFKHMKENIKLIQIIIGESDVLYGLDRFGRVWRRGIFGWQKINMEEYEKNT